jgi:2-polyprenyl-6-methoxyphenol hydroxylase-like FAD-dependent oxidoreductase
MRALRVGIVGCGTAGAAADLFLSRAGHDVTLFERVPEPGPVGAGIMMQPSGLLVLERLGLAERILTRGARVDRLVCETTAGARLLDLEYAVLGEGLFGVGLHRGVLFETLYAALRASAVHLRLGVEIVRARPPRRGQTPLVDEGGAEHGPFDLVVVCDGARSRVRDAMVHLTRTVTPYPWGALWFIGEDRDERHAGRLYQRVRGARRMVGLLPTGLGPGDGKAPLVSLFVSTRAADVDAVRARGLAAWKDAVRAISPDAEAVLDQIDDFDALTFAAYYDVVLPRWHARGVAILGDAAHATSPQLGQGCNLALCDAAALADAVDAEPTVDRALERYTASRRDHLAFYQLATRWLTPLFQSDAEMLGLARDLVFPLAARLGFAQREMVRSMAGTKTGLLFGSRETRMPKRS